MIAVILLNYNSSADCSKCISFVKQQRGVGYEIIVVDNGSRTEEIEQLRLLCENEKCILLESKENKGYNAGNNIGLRYAARKGYPYALILNPDMELIQPEYLRCVMEVMERDSQVVVVGTDIINAENIHQNPMAADGNWKHQFGWVKALFRRSGKPIDSYDFVDNYRESHYCQKVSGCCFLIKISFLQQIDFFDEYPFLYCEEAILSRQVEQAGYKMYYDASSLAIHRHISAEKENPAIRFRHWKRSRIYFYNKYSNDSWLGKKISTISMTMYVYLYLLYFRIKKGKK